MLNLNKDDKIAFISDIHLGDEHHARKHKMALIEYHNYIISDINRQIDKDTVLIMPGDIVCDVKYVGLLDKIAAKRIICITGNRECRDPEIIVEIVKRGYGGFSSLRLGKNLVTHIPPHSMEATKHRKIIHGHLHNDRIYHSTYVNVAHSINRGVVKWYDEIVSL